MARRLPIFRLASSPRATRVATVRAERPSRRAASTMLHARIWSPSLRFPLMYPLAAWPFLTQFSAQPKVVNGSRFLDELLIWVNVVQSPLTYVS